MTRHPTTQDMRQLLAAMRANTKPGTKPLSEKEQAALAASKRQITHFDARRVGGMEERMVPIMGHGPGAIPGTRPGERL